MINNNLLSDQLAYFDTQLKASFFALFLLSFIVAYLFWENAGIVQTLVWLGINVTVIGIRLFISRSYRKQRQSPIPVNLKHYYRLFFLGVTLTALVWSGGSFLFFVPDSPPQQVILAFVYAGITSGAVASLSVRKEYYFVYLALFLLPLIYLFSQEPNNISTTMVAMILVYGLFLTSISSKYSRMINEGIMIRYENLELIENLKEATKAAKSASDAKSEFLANMSHEIRTPMTGILGFVEQLAKDENDPKRMKQFDVIKNSAHTLLGIINDILDLSKIESGKISLDIQAQDIHKVFEEIVTLFDEQMIRKKLHFEKQIAAEIPKCLMIDQLRFKQVIFNLLSNAIKFTPGGGKIVLKADFDRQREMLRCAVIDNGIGIEKEYFKKIFEAFDQEDTSITRRFGGIGLGLTISSRLLNLMGSKLQLKSTLGKGSRFYFDIPAQDCSDTPQANIENSPDIKKSEKIVLQGHALIVDDQTFNQMLLGTILQQYGVTYDTAGDGVEALGLYKDNIYDIIFMDENMPNMNGIEATRQIRSREGEYVLMHTPIVAITANALTEDRQRFLDAGMDEYISKPYTEEDIVKILKKFLTQL